MSLWRGSHAACSSILRKYAHKFKTIPSYFLTVLVRPPLLPRLFVTDAKCQQAMILVGETCWSAVLLFLLYLSQILSRNLLVTKVLQVVERPLLIFNCGC